VTIRDRLSLAAASAVVLASSGLTPMYQDLAWLPFVLGAIVAVASASSLARLASAPRALQRVAGLLGLMSFVTLAFAGSTLVYGVLPTLTTVTSLTASVTAGLEDVRRLAAPVPTTPQLVLLAALGTGGIAVVVDLLAVVGRKVALSGLPLLLLFAVPSAVLRGGLGVLPFLLGAAGWLGLLLTDSSDRAARWGTPLPGGRAPTRDLGLGRVGRRIGAAALGVAAVIPLLVPGLDGRLLGGIGTGTGGAGRTVHYDSVAELDGWLRDRERRPLLTYHSTAGPVFLRRTTLDVYDPRRGRFTSSGLSVGDDAVQDGVQTPEGRTAPIDVFDVEVELTGQLGGSLLPVPATPFEIEIDGAWQWDAVTETVFSTSTSLLSTGGSYEVRTARVRVDATLLRREQTVPTDIRKVYAKDPELSDDAQALLDRITDGLHNDFDRVAAVQRLFRETDFVYSTQTAPRPPGSPDPLTAFLQTRQGACQQYASAMAALVRGLGIPARVATGFTGGSRIGPDRYLVTTREAHAWPEVWFEGAGWVRFEPTPRADVRIDPPATASNRRWSRQRRTAPSRRLPRPLPRRPREGAPTEVTAPPTAPRRRGARSSRTSRAGGWCCPPPSCCSRCRPCWRPCAGAGSGAPPTRTPRGAACRTTPSTSGTAGTRLTPRALPPRTSCRPATCPMTLRRPSAGSPARSSAPATPAPHRPSTHHSCGATSARCVQRCVRGRPASSGGRRTSPPRRPCRGHAAGPTLRRRICWTAST
jgi:transglutaminase-like putative cysteine protease